MYLAWGNSSSRIDQIEDVRATYTTSLVYVTYQFTYNNDAGVPHLTGITNTIGTPEGYTFSYSGNVSLTSPWGLGSGSTTTLTNVSISLPGGGLQYALTYDASAALTKVQFPYGGYLRWEYADSIYTQNTRFREQREVANRYLSADGTQAHETAA